ncbi:MAG TPA: DUF1080 domain-containing protein [Planctomycetota bacterium]|nr:DUF1080 domain-containing protein [Planctomycetota bacterium]
MLFPRPIALISLLLLAACHGPAPVAQERWVPLFNGRNLDGWQPKITGFELGDNFGQTFRVEDGLLKVRYDAYDQFDGHYGHLFFDAPFSNYDLLVEYRFVGEACPGGAGWAWRNSGVMIHSQAPQTMRVDQDFPVSIEVQTLGSTQDDQRPTANLCTPGTNVHMNGALHTQHCTNSTSPPQFDDQWVRMRVEVRGGEVIRHFVDDALVLEYTQPTLDTRDADAAQLLAGGQPELLTSGYLCLQSESFPVDFRRVEILVHER